MLPKRRKLQIFDQWMESLSTCPLFTGVEKEELSGMLDCLRPRLAKYSKNQYVTMAGSPLEGVGIILEGEVAVTRENAEGNRVIMAVLEPGDIFGEMAAFAAHREWPASVQAQGACTVIFLPPEKIIGNCENQCEGHRQLMKNMLRIVSSKALMLNRKVEYLAIRNLRSRISVFLLEEYQKTNSPCLELPLKRHELADYLNVSRPSLSRELARMRDEGIIDFHRNTIVIKDLEILRSLA